MTNSHSPSSAATGEAAIERAAREATLANRLYRSEGDLWVDTPINLSKFVRFLALQPHVVSTGDVAQSAQVRNATIEECARITTAPFGLAYTSQRHKEVAKDVADQIGRAIRALAAQPPAAPVDTDWFDECAKQAGKAFRYWLALEKAEERFRGLDYLDFANEIRAAMADPPEPMPVPSSSAESAAWDQPALDLVNQIWDIPADWHPARRKAHAQVLIIEALKARRTSTEPQTSSKTEADHG